MSFTQLDPMELRELAHFWEEVRAARRIGLRGQVPTRNMPPPQSRPLQGVQDLKLGSSHLLQLFEQNITMLEVRTPDQNAGPELLSVTCGLTPLDDVNRPLLNHGIDIFGTATWGVAGSSFQANFDIVNGTGFSVPANYLRIDVTYNGTAPAPPFLPVQFQANAGVGYGTMATQISSPLRRTIDLGILQPNASAFFLCPAFSTSFAVTTDDPLSAPGVKIFSAMQIVLFNTGTGSSQTYDYTTRNNTGRQDQASYLIGNASQLLGQVVNIGAQPQSVQLIFNLSF